jgi:hypothetical protein
MGGDIYGTLLAWQPSSMIGINIRATLSLVLYFGCAFMLAAINYVVVGPPDCIGSAPSSAGEAFNRPHYDRAMASIGSYAVRWK